MGMCTGEGTVGEYVSVRVCVCGERGECAHTCVCARVRTCVCVCERYMRLHTGAVRTPGS